MLKRVDITFYDSHSYVDKIPSIQITNENFFTKELDLSEKAFKFNVYKKGKNLRKQLAKLKNNFSNFIYHLSLDSPNNNRNLNSKTNTNKVKGLRRSSAIDRLLFKLINKDECFEEYISDGVPKVPLK